MAPIVPFIPLIAAGLSTAGGVTAAAISSRASNKAASEQAAATKSAISNQTNSVLDNPASALGAVTANQTTPLGDTSTPSLNRNKLLGN